MRKTNLFYSRGNDSNFVTFSNYTEALTGNILATNYKLFPSKFICLYIPKLDGLTKVEDPETGDISYVLINDFEFIESKEDFIVNWLSGYYENKLAIIRDWCLGNNEKVEEYINPLDYLLHAIYEYDPGTEMTFIGDICEQEYNGTFMDNICIIENNATADTYKYYYDVDSESTRIEMNNAEFVPEVYKNKHPEWLDKLYGWAGADPMPQGFEEVTPKYDFDAGESHAYYHDSSSTIEKNAEASDEIKFNVLIPLFDIFEWKTLSNAPVEQKPTDKLLVLNSGSTHNQYDIPIGMWFSDKCIKLERAEQTEGQTVSYRPSWSLCISAQFKPFPFSDKYPNEIEEYSNPDKFASFALIMSKQAHIVNEFRTLSSNYAYLANEIYDLSLELRALRNDNEEESENDVTVKNITRINNEIKHINDEIAAHQENLININELFIEMPTTYVLSEQLESTVHDTLNFIKASEIDNKVTELGFVNHNEIAELIGSYSYVHHDDLEEAILSYGFVTDANIGEQFVSHQYLIDNAYVTMSSLNEYLDQPVVSYVKNSEFENMVAKSSYVHDIQNFDRTINDSSAGGALIKTNVQSFTQNPQKSLIATRVQKICGGTGPSFGSMWKSGADASSNTFNVKDGYTIPELYSYSHTTFPAEHYESYNHVLERLKYIDGQGLTGGVSGFMSNSISAFNNAENSLSDLTIVFAYLVNKTDIFNHLDLNDEDDNAVANALTHIIGATWKDIYLPGQQN